MRKSPFEEIKSSKSCKDAEEALRNYISFVQKLGLVAEKVKEKVDDAEIDKISSVECFDNSVHINFTFKGVSKTFKLVLTEEAYNNIIDPIKFPSDWKRKFLERAIVFLESKADEAMTEMGKWMTKAQIAKDELEKENSRI